ncbi:MAG: hypothetical protein KatS3mg108_0323 [Isosphaeraceae bacterium]|jgi:putative heme iron utilization protein|nr:MAG: hypothetical protein KatS3mg108_0323 [Isosphaeraceae bacterium]
MDTRVLEQLGRLIGARRVAALGTLRAGAPLVSMVAYVVEPEAPALVVHISRLAYHTQDVMADPRVGVLVAEEDSDAGRDPQTLARVSLWAVAEEVARGTGAYEELRMAYLGRFPDAERLFGFGDFGLYRLRIQAARLVAGFGQTYNLSAEQVRQALLGLGGGGR